MKIANISERFLIYLVEQSFLIPLSSLLDYSLGIKARILGFLLSYNIDFSKSFLPIFTTVSGWYNILALFTVSITYYSLESMTNIGLAESLFKINIINKYSLPHHQQSIILLFRNIIKSIFITNLLNSLFILRNKKYIQNLYDYKFNLFTIKDDGSDNKSLFFQYFYAALVSYYGMFFLLFLIYGLFVPTVAQPNSGITTSPSFNFLAFFNSVLRNNLELDLAKYILGGFSLFIGTFITLFSSNILETAMLASLYNAHGASSFFKYVLPQFFPETMGYVFGIAISMVIADIMLSYLQSMLRNQKSEYFLKRTKELVINAGYYFALSITLLIVGALVESSLGILNI